MLSPELVGVYVNPDEIQFELERSGGLDLSTFHVRSTTRELRSFFAKSSLLAPRQIDLLQEQASVRRNRLTLPAQAADAYVASVLSDFLRRKLIAAGESFTFETVMSSPDKVSLLDDARANGFRTYLYYIATDDPEINISRVQNRVNLGGHSVPREKIVARYERSLGLLLAAIRRTDRAYLFDNSGNQPVWLAEVIAGTELKLKTDLIPQWLIRSILDKLAGPSGGH